MQKILHFVKSNSSLTIALIAGLAVRLLVAWQPVSFLLERNLPDDAYYYFLIARNLARLGSVSFDGLHLTNGFHPLWLVLILPVFRGAAWPGDLQVHLILTIASLLDVISIWMIARITWELTGRRDLAALAAFLYAINPFAVFQATNGLETALAMALLTTFTWIVLRWLANWHDWKWALAAGLTGGLAFLARSDTIFYLIFLFASVLWRQGLRNGFRRVVAAGGTAGLVVAPWFIWSKIATGSWMQVSGTAVPYAIWNRLDPNQTGLPFQAIAQQVITQLVNPAMWMRGDPTGLPFLLGALLWVVVIGLLIRRWRTPGSSLEKTILIPLVAGGVALIIVHAGIRGYPRPWYFIPSAAAFAVSCSVAVERFTRKPRLPNLVGFSFGLYLLLSLFAFWQFGLYPWQKDMRSAADWVAENIPAGQAVGSFNAGIYAYYSNHPVINLDGVVNNDAFHAIQDREILAYLNATQVGYLVDYDHAIKNEYSLFMGKGYPQALYEIQILGGRADSLLGLLRAYQVSFPADEGNTIR